jgi:hypothetical protein
MIDDDDDDDDMLNDVDILRQFNVEGCRRVDPVTNRRFGGTYRHHLHTIGSIKRQKCNIIRSTERGTQ